MERFYTFIFKRLFLLLIVSFSYLSAQNMGPTDDFDGDGIINSVDIDDDNDGVTDAVESPSCYYLASEWNTGVKPTTNGVTISSALTTTTANFDQLLDNVTGTTAVTFTAGQAIANANVYLFTFAQAVRLDALYLKFNTATQFVGNTKIQGSNTNNGSDWVDLSANVAATAGPYTTVNGNVSLTTSIKYPVTLNATTAYKYIRITGAASATTSASAQNSSEVYFDFNIANYVASYYPKATCTDANIDGDGILPHFDLDSDGDGCSDAYEAGATTSLATNYKFTGAVGTNGLDNTLETPDNGIVNYTSTYHAYAQSSAIQVCKDTDGDGILDINDIDDDNDGIPDLDEQARGNCNTTNCTSWVSPASTVAGTSAPATIIVDGEEVSYTITRNTSFTQQSAAGYTLQCSGAAVTGIPYWQRVDANNQTMTFNFSKPVTNFQIIMAAIETAPPGLIESIQVTTNNSTGQQTICESCNKSGIVTIDGQNLTVLGNGTGTEIFNVNGPTFTSITIKVTSVGGAFLMSYGLCALKTYSESVYTDIDTDGDGIPNRLDLDSDGDGCPDLKEAKVTPLTDVITASATNNVGGSYGIANPAGAQLNPAAADVNNDGLNDSVDSDVNGSPDYSSTYNPIAISKAVNLCSDMDGDGILDVTDIDDDNDGITDVIESPGCFYTISDLKSTTNITSGLSYTIGNVFSQAIDGDTTTWADIANGLVMDKDLIEVTMPLANPVPISTVTIQIGINNAFPGSSFQLQGWTGNSWEAMSATQAMTAPNTTYTFTNTLHPTKTYNKFRIRGLAGYATSGTRLHEVNFTFTQPFVSALQPKATCTNDPDNDGIYNHQDLDSDGDGCSDLSESGVSPSTDVSTPPSANNNNGISYGIDSAKLAGSQLNPAATDANNDGLNDSVDPDLNGITNYVSTYDPYAIGSNFAMCRDSDGDGINDVDDIDDDNDGILDAVESPFCFYTENEAKKIASGTLTSNFVWFSSQPLTNVYDGDVSTIGLVNPAVVNTAGLSLIDFTLPTQKSALVSNIQLMINGRLSGATTSQWRLEGWNGTAWVALSAAQDMFTQTTTYTFSNTLQSTTKYSRYRIAGTPGSTGGIPANGGLYEVIINYNNYVPSANPKPTCTDDFDGDGILNHLDLDSDNDGCPDVKESGVAPLTDIFTPSSTNNNDGFSYGIASGNLTNSQLNPAGTDANNDGLNDSVDSDLNGATNYTSTYDLYALNIIKNGCLDTDGDGVADLFDIDDDNDGVLDTTESQICPPPSGTGRAIVWDREAERTLAADLAYFTSKPAISMLPGAGTNIPPSASGAWFLQGLNNNGTLSDAIAKDDYQYATFTTGASLLYVDAWVYLTLSPLINVGILIDDEPTFSHPSILNDGVDITTPTGTMPGVGGTWNIDPISNPMYLQPNKTYYVRFYDLTTNTQITHDLIGLRFFAATAADAACSTDIDTDNDGIPNRLDLDSDGDGCPDTKEAILYNHATEASIPGTVQNGSGGAVNSTTPNVPNAMVPGPYGSNGFADALQSSSNPDAYKYVYSYLFVATDADVSTCDNKFLYDIDSDDDGIPDAVESPSCFYTEAQAMDITEGVTSDFTWSTANPLSNTYDDNTATTNFGAVSVPTATSIQNKALITFNLPVIDATFINSVTLNVGSTNFGAGKWKLQGLDVMTNTWIDLSVATGQALNTSTVVFNNTLQNNTRYYSYRIIGVDNVNITNNARLIEFTIQYKNYNPSYHRTKTGCNSDADGDGVPNYIDRDSDGDGCPDALEAGISKSLLVPNGFFNTGGQVMGDYVTVGGNYGDNGLGDSVETAPDSGIVNYTSTYTQYATNKTLNFCTDTDGDSVPDLIDLDDDNDGVLDTTECAYPAIPTTSSTANIFASWSNTGNTQGTNSVPAYIASIGSWTAGSGLTATVNASNYIDISNVNAATLADAFGTNEYLEHPFTTTADNYNWLYYIKSSANNATNYHWSMLISDDNFATYNILNIDMLRNTTGNIVYDINDYQLKPSTSYKVRTYYWGATTLTFDEFTMFGYSECDTDNDGVPNRLDLDSDGDGCTDAVESGTAAQAGAGNTSSGTLVNVGGTQTGVANAIVGNNTPSAYGANGFYNGIENNDTASAAYIGTYTYASAINAAISACFCYKTPAAGTGLETHQGITSLQRAGTDNSGWPMVRKGAWTALESKTKAFVPNRLTITEINNIPVANLKEGMMVYNISSDCIYINTDGTATGWKCFNTQTCP